MKPFILSKDSRVMRSVRHLAFVVAAVVAVLVASGYLASRGAAASPMHSFGMISYPGGGAKIGAPKLRHGVLLVNGTRASDRISLRLKAGDPSTLEVDFDDGSAVFPFARADVTKIVVNARAGNDLVRIDESGGVFTDSIPTTLGGGNGNDRLEGGSGSETLIGGSGNDSIDGNRGSDRALMGAGNDTFVWDPGDGSDTVEGQAGKDTMRFNGANVAEHVELSANGERLRFFRDVAGITMDTAGVERVDFNALGGADVVTVDDLRGTDVREVNIDLASTLGGTSGDGAADRVVVKGTNGNDRIAVSGASGNVTATGLAATVRTLHAEAATDRLEIDTLAGVDRVDAGGLAPGAIQLFVDGALVQ
jgi:Ca2+-binding RTX toxin-like protein